jgi:hypothetical protein
MADPEASPRDQEQAEPEAPLGGKPTEDEILQAMADLAEATQTVETDDVSFAFAPEEGEQWLIPTGRFDPQGRQMALKVKVRDPRNPVLPTQYFAAVTKIGESRAALGLWQACIVEPKALKNPKMYEQTTTAFRATLTQRLLAFIGVNGDFLAATVAVNSRAHPMATKSSTTLPPASVSIPEPSPAGAPSSSTTATNSPVASMPVTVPSA